jgi:hypothetical protein
VLRAVSVRKSPRISVAQASLAELEGSMQRVLGPIVMGIAVLAACLRAGVATAQEEVQLKGSALARAAQQELYRLGCYNDAINGVWTSPSRSAAQKFLSRVNARLPIEQPDEALLALLRSTKGFACSQCPVGEAFNSAGDCVPKALVDKPIKTMPITTGGVPDPPRSNEHASSDDLSGQRDPAGQGKPSGQASGASKYWRILMKTVDRAFGFE